MKLFGRKEKSQLIAVSSVPNNRVQNYRKFLATTKIIILPRSGPCFPVSIPLYISRYPSSVLYLFPLRPSIILIHCRRKSWCIRHGLGSALDMEAVKRLHGTSIFHVPSIRETRIVNQAILGFRYLLCRRDPVGFLITETVGFLHWIRLDTIIPRNPRGANRVEYISFSLFAFNSDSATHRTDYITLPLWEMDTKQNYVFSHRSGFETITSSQS